jgi:putative Mg2+ transporter-C (MgtC) family protein
VIAYVVSGVGFLGAGAIMKEGANIRGLNTAATLWCSAAVGACVGAGELLDATFVTALLIGINIALRPLSRYIDRRSLASLNLHTLYRIRVVCPTERWAETEHHLTHAIAERSVILREMRAQDNEETHTTLLQAVLESNSRNAKTLEDLASNLRAFQGVESVEIAATDPEAE